jgi:TMEM175 potassium channel family protein
MTKGRLEAFSDGVFAIIITIMVLNLRVPHGTNFADLRPIVPVFLSYVLSFLYVGIYWNNHHHLLHAAERVDGKILWANLHLLFWLSLAPFTTAWLGENGITTGPVAMYGIMLLFAGIAYFILTKALIAQHGKDSKIAESIGKDRKGLASVLIHFVALPICFVEPAVSCAAYVLVLVMWLLPDPRIEKCLHVDAVASERRREA